jgi:hypothetical protein
MVINGKEYIVKCPTCNSQGIDAIIHTAGCKGLPVNEKGEVNAILVPTKL